MAFPAVHWHEGMFLRPHHFQAAEKYLLGRIRTGEQWDQPFNWGLHALDINPEALLTNVLEIRTLQARSRAGTVVSIPAEGTLSQVTLKPFLENYPAVFVFLGIPLLQSGRANVQGESPEETAVRFAVATDQVEDENQAGRAEAITLRRLNFRLLFSPQLSAPEHPGFELICLARIERSARPDAAPQMDPTFIPPLLACEASGVLSREIMQKLYYRINTKGELLALQVKGRGIGFESLAPGEAEVFNHLRLLNEAQAVLRGLAFITSLHPFIAYLGLCDLAGRLAILGPDRRVPELPLYDHDDLGNCFFTLKRYLDTLLDTIEEPQYEVASFAGIGYSMEAKLRAKWLEEEWQLLISVESPLPPAECANMLEYGGMDMKVSSAALAEEQVLRGLASLTLKHTPDQVPHILPRGPRLAYFQLVRPRPLEEDRSERNKQNANAWEAVRQSKSLAIRLNRSKIVGDLSGRDSVKVKHGSATPELKFTLYALPPDRGGRVRSSASGIR